MEKTIKKIDDTYFTEDDASGFTIEKPKGVITLGVKEDDSGNKKFKPFNMDYELLHHRVVFTNSTFTIPNSGGSPIEYGDGWMGGNNGQLFQIHPQTISEPIDVSKFFKGHLVVEWKELAPTYPNPGTNPPTLVDGNGTIIDPPDSHDYEDSTVDVYICNIGDEINPNSNPLSNSGTLPDYQFDAEYWRFFKTLKFRKHIRRVYHDNIKNPYNDDNIVINPGVDNDYDLYNSYQYLRGECYVCSEEISFPSKWIILKAVKAQGSLCRVQAHLFSKK